MYICSIEEYSPGKYVKPRNGILYASNKSWIPMFTMFRSKKIKLVTINDENYLLETEEDEFNNFYKSCYLLTLSSDNFTKLPEYTKHTHVEDYVFMSNQPAKILKVEKIPNVWYFFRECEDVYPIIHTSVESTLRRLMKKMRRK